MNDVNRGVQRVKVATVELTGDFHVAEIIQESLTVSGYDIDIEPINTEFHRPQGEKINVYAVKR